MACVQPDSRRLWSCWRPRADSTIRTPNRIVMAGPPAGHPSTLTPWTCLRRLRLWVPATSAGMTSLGGGVALVVQRTPLGLREQEEAGQDGDRGEGERVPEARIDVPRR